MSTNNKKRFKLLDPMRDGKGVEKGEDTTPNLKFFFKQWGTWGSDGIKRNKHANGKMLQGEIIQQMPKKTII